MSLSFVIPEFNIGGAGTPPLQFFRRGFILNGTGGSGPDWKDIILHGNTALTLVNSKADGLNYLKLFGNTEQLAETYIDSVTLEGKCEQRNLPEGYTQVESLANTSDAYITTSISLDDNDEIEFWWNAEASGSIFAFSQGASTDNQAFQLANTNATGIVFDIQNYTPYRINTNVQGYGQGVRHIQIIKKELFIDGVSYGTSQGSLTSPTDVLRLFISSADAITQSKFTNRFTVKNKINLIPARRNSDSVLGMYDTITNTFLTNAGTGSFTAGADVTTPTPDSPVDIVCNNGVVKVIHNLIDLNAVTDRYYYDTQGNYTAFSTSRTTDYIPIEAGRSVTIYFKSLAQISNLNVRINIFNSNKVWQSQEVLQLSPLTEGTMIITPTYNGYIRVSGNYSSTAIVEWDTAKIVYGEYTVATIGSAIGTIYTDGTVETVTDSNQLTATAQMLLSVGDYKDTQEVLTGVVARNVGVKVLDGTEDWTKSGNLFYADIATDALEDTHSCYCTHFKGIATNASASYQDEIKVGTNATQTVFWARVQMYPVVGTYSDVNAFTQWLSDQYNAGTPVIVIYPTNSATTETVTGQFLSKEPVTVTGSLTGLVANVVSSSHTTPTPTQPLPINCNNGVVKVSPNLFKSSDITTSTVSNVTISVAEDGTITANGTSSASVYSQFVFPLSNPITEGTYTLSLYNSETLANGSLVGLAISTTVSTRIARLTSANSMNTITINSGETCNNLIIRIAGTANQFKFKIQIEKGDQGTTYRPYGIYTDGTTETVEVTGKNLFNKNSYTEINAYVNSNTGILTQGSPGEATQYCAVIPCLPNTTYTISGRATSAWGAFTSNNIGTTATSYNKTENGSITTGANDKYLIGLVRANQDVIDYRNTLQVELGSTATTYEPYFNGGSLECPMLLSVGS